jgi:beta-galactosidase/beta-glucuronidase
MLNCDRDGYDLRVRLHHDANLVMIRNWVGMVGREAFYDACDRYGILIWDDFWLANPGDGPNPKDRVMFTANARDKIRRVLSHPALAVLHFLLPNLEFMKLKESNE